jgi:hypothetical protein
VPAYIGGEKYHLFKPTNPRPRGWLGHFYEDELAKIIPPDIIMDVNKIEVYNK